MEKFVESCGDNLSIDLFAFSSKVEPKKSFTKKTLPDLIAALTTMLYDGATRLDILRPTVALHSYDCFLMFSDGINSLGRSHPRATESR